MEGLRKIVNPLSLYKDAAREGKGEAIAII